MKKFKAKLMALLVAVGCCSVCAGVGVALAQQEPVNITASAEVTTHNIGALTLHVNSQPWGGAGGASNQLYLQRADGGALPVLTWDHLFTYESGDGFKVNGVKKTPAEVKSTDAGFFWLFDALSAGDEITIGGTFYCETLQTRYVIEKSTSVWNGTNWSTVVDVSSFATTVIHEIKPANGCTDSVIYAYDADGIKPSLNNWADKLTFLEGSGKGFCLNGTPLAGWEIKQPGDFYIVLGKEAVEGCERDKNDANGGSGENSEFFRHVLGDSLRADFAKNQDQYGNYNGGNGCANITQDADKKKRAERRKGDVNDIIADQNGRNEFVVALCQFQGKSGTAVIFCH